MQIAQLVQEKPKRVPLAAFVDRDVHERLFELAREEDSSVSRIVRRALAAELERKLKGSDV